MNYSLKIDLSAHSFSEPFTENIILLQHFQWIHSLKIDSSAQSFSEPFTKNSFYAEMRYKLCKLCENRARDTPLRGEKPQNRPLSKLNKQSDSDPIPTWLLKECSSVLVPTITNLWSPYGIGRPYIFSSCFFFLLFFCSPNLSGRRLDVYHTLAHGVALVRI